MGFLIALLVVAGAVAAYGVTLYNRLVALRNAAESAWSDVDVQLKRRWDLVPNLVETVKGYASHEKSTFEEVVEARPLLAGPSADIAPPARAGPRACWSGA